LGGLKVLWYKFTLKEREKFAIALKKVFFLYKRRKKMPQRQPSGGEAYKTVFQGRHVRGRECPAAPARAGEHQHRRNTGNRGPGLT